MNDDTLPPVDDEAEGGFDQPAPGRGKPAQKSSAAGTFAPVGDIQVKKKSKTYNTYTLSLSMGQIEAIHSALEKDHANPIADELLKLFAYYMQNVPGPGEEEEDIKAQDEQASVNGEEGEEEDDGLPIPMPPGYKGDGRTTVAGEGEDTDFGDTGGEEAQPYEDEEEIAPDAPEEDRRLPAPPRE